MKKLKGEVKKIWESKIPTQPSKNKHISYSAISTYQKCPRAWQLLYRDKIVSFQQNIHLVFGSAMHETIQEWLTVMYQDSVKKANEINLHDLLYVNLSKAYRAARAQNNGEHFTSADQMTQFWNDGKKILDYLVNKRAVYFSTRTMQLAGVETLLYQELRPGVKFKGFIDLVFYHPNIDRWTIMDIKTSTRGWNEDAKKNEKLTAQVILYKEFFSKQFGIDKDKIDLEYFIIKRKVNEDAEFESMRRRVQTFIPNDGPRITKRVLEALDTFVQDVVDENGEFYQHEFKCKSPIGVCNECKDLQEKVPKV